MMLDSIVLSTALASTALLAASFLSMVVAVWSASTGSERAFTAAVLSTATSLAMFAVLLPVSLVCVFVWAAKRIWQ